MFKLFKKIIKSVVDFVKSIFSKEEKKQEAKTKEEKLGELFDTAVTGNPILEKDLELFTADTPSEAIFIVKYFTGRPMHKVEGRIVYFLHAQHCENLEVQKKLEEKILKVVLDFGPQVIKTEGISSGIKFMFEEIIERHNENKEK